MPGAAYASLFEIVVIHEYFTDPASCRFDFLPDTAAAAWLRRTGCVLRRHANRLQVMAETAGDAITRAGPAMLNFTVRATDPGLDCYTAGVRPAAASEAESVFDTASAVIAQSDGGFVITVPLAAAGDHGRVHRVVLASRTMPWTYVLSGDWSAEDPVIVDPAAAAVEETFEPVAGPPGSVALAFRSRLPLPLVQRPQRRFELWSRRNGTRDRLIIKTLPMPNAANLARSEPADRSTLVCEIFVSR